MKITIVLALFFVFRFIRYVLKGLYQVHITNRQKEKNLKNNPDPNSSLFNNLMAIVIWGAYFILALAILQVPKSGISIVTAGLATGIGFAMKDLLENFFYGISLMTGRVRVGDWIECDGTRGRVKEVTYQCTMLETLDGCVIAFLNSSLFSKNFKNLTSNHEYELVQIPFGVAYGSDVKKVRDLVTQAVLKTNERLESGHDAIDINVANPVKVAFTEFADSSVNLCVLFYSDVAKKFWIVSKAKEAIYDTLNANGIEIPFPQRDLHIRSNEAGLGLNVAK